MEEEQEQEGQSADAREIEDQMEYVPEKVEGQITNIEQ